MKKKITKFISIFIVAGVVCACAAGIVGCSKPDVHTHTAGTTWQSDTTSHWKLCTAGDGEKVNFAAHADADNDGKCDVCQYVMSSPDHDPDPDPEPQPHIHTAGTTWEKNETDHWNLCTAGDGEKMNVAPHIDTNNDGKCDICQYVMSTPDTEPEPKPQPANPTVSGVTVVAAGNATTVENGGRLTLCATVVGENNPAQTVTWSIKTGATATQATVSPEGVLSAGTVAGTVTIVATSTVDTSKSGEITITVDEPIVIEAIDGETSVAEGCKIKLTAITNDKKGVIWSIDDTAVATIDESGWVTGVATGMATVTATSKTDETVTATCDVVVTKATRYVVLANRGDNRLAENFGSFANGTALADFDGWGAAGVYTKTDGDVKVTVNGGVAKAENSEKLKDVSLMVDFGAVVGVVEGVFDFKFLASPGGKGGNSVNFYNGETKVLTVTGNAVGTAYTIENIPGIAAQPTTTLICDDNTVTVEFKFDLTAKKVSLKLNGNAVCEDLACDISRVSGFEVVTSDGGLCGIEVDNIAVCGW